MDSSSAGSGTLAERKLRFAMVTTFYPPYSFGGDAQAVRQLAHALAAYGHQVDIVHDVDAFTMLGGRAQAPLPEPENIRVHALRSRLARLSCLATHQTGRPVVHGGAIRQILEQPFDVIHFHNASLVGGPGLFGFGDAIKLYSAHEHWLVCPTHILWRHGREICDGRQCLRCGLNYRRPPQSWRGSAWFERQCSHIDAFLTYSRFCADKHAEFGFQQPLRVVPPFLPNDAAPSNDALDEGGVPNDETPDAPYFLFVGRLEAIKGLQDVIPLFGGHGTTELRIAGAGGDEARLRELARGLTRVRFLGQQQPEALRRLYRGAIALVVPSVCYEVFPMVVLEAFREGTPIIARKLGPLPEIVTDSGGGVLFETTEELREALAVLSTDDGQRGRLGAAARRAFLTRWSEGPALESYFTLLHDLARRRAAGAAGTAPLLGHGGGLV